MRFTVEDLLKSELGSSLTLQGGNRGIANDITGVTIIEAPDIVRFIHGGELLLTGLYAFADCSVEEFRDYISELKNKAVSGIVLKPGRKVRDSETKISLLTEYAERHGIPLMTVPFEVSFQTILTLVMEHLVSDEVTQLKYYKTTRDNFNAATTAGGSGAHRIDVILNMLEKLIGNPVALFRENMVCCAVSGEFRENFSVSPRAVRYDPGMFSSFTYLIQTVEGKSGSPMEQVISRMTLDNGENMFLAVDCVKTPFSTMSCIAMENACLALNTELSRLQAVEEVEKRFRSDMLSGILHGTDLSGEELRKNAALIGMEADGDYRVLVVELQTEIWDQKKMDERISALNLLEELIHGEHPEHHVCREPERILVVRREEKDIKQQEYRSSLRSTVEQLQRKAEAKDKNIRIQVGAGKQCQGVEKVAQSCQEACDACSFIDVAGDAVGDVLAGGNAHMVMFSDLGVFKLLSRITDPEELREYIPESLQKLYNVRKSQREELVETLKTYLDCSQNLSQTSRKLYIHYKTAAYRIDKISEITGMDFENAGEMLAVRIGLVVNQMIDNIKSRNGKGE